MKLPLKTITFLVYTALAAIFLFQLYCLHNLYETRKQEMEESMVEALRISDYNEMVLRIAKLSQKTQTHGEVSYATGYKMDVDNQMVYAGSVTTVRQKGYDAIIMKDEELTDTITIRRDSVAGKRHMHVDVHSYDTEETEKNKALVSGGEGLFSAVVDDQKSVRDLTQMMQQGIHNGVDLLSEPDVAVFDSLLTLRLQEHHIDTAHRLEQLHFQVNAVNETDSLGIDTLNMITTSHYQPTVKAVHYDYHYTSSQHDLYRLWMEPVAVSVLKSLKGIIASSLFTLIVLAFTFWYLIRTLLKQKTLEEMKSDFTHNITHDGTTFISVSDRSIGITPEQQRHIFEKFYRVPQGNLHDVKGHGLGLYYVSTMMQLHRGTVSINSTPGKGSTFILHFPKPNAHTLNLLAWLQGGMLISFLSFL